MMKAASKAGKQGKVKNSLHDKTFTPRAAAAACMQILDIEKTDHCLDPARGGGAFYDQFTCNEDHKHYCEIDEGIDFLTWTPEAELADKNGCTLLQQRQRGDGAYHLDWIITNPPYSKNTGRWTQLPADRSFSKNKI